MASKRQIFRQNVSEIRTEICSLLGKNLTRVLFDYEHRKARDLLGLSSASHAAPSQSPRRPARSIESLGKAPHRRILELGEALVKAQEKRIEETSREKVETELKERRYEYEARMRSAVEARLGDIYEKSQWKKSRAEIQQLEKKMTEAMHVEKCQLELRNIANIVCLLCAERSRDREERCAAYRYLEIQILELRASIARLRKIVRILESRMTGDRKEKASLKRKTREILQAFQRFVNFVFDFTSEGENYLLPATSGKTDP
ncbi:hypothetical protein KM043_003386 [Ampulex compressa]|nr:hypothetical protein KM043_003386 [Ampulex compressa]